MVFPVYKGNCLIHKSPFLFTDQLLMDTQGRCGPPKTVRFKNIKSSASSSNNNTKTHIDTQLLGEKNACKF